MAPVTSSLTGPLGTRHIASTDGVTVALHDLGGDGPPLLLCHPTGFHGLAWAPVAAALSDVAHCWALDFRGHGDSNLPASGSLDWQGMADDVRAVLDHLGGSGDGRPSGVGHSMGGTALFLTEQAHPGTWSSLWCYEPIVFPRLDEAGAIEVPPDGAPPGGRPARDLPRPRQNPLAAASRRRKAVFPNREAALQNYASKPPLDVLDPAALAAYVDHGFRDRPDGSVELKCAPETEARVFESGVGHDAFAGLGAVTCPTVVAASGDGAPPARVAALVAEGLPNGRLERFPELTHFGPLEAPVVVAASIRASLPGL